MPSKLQPKRKHWTDENMLGAVKDVQKGKGIRQSARLYKVPVESLWQWVNGAVDVLTLKLYSLKVLFRLVLPSFTCISTSARKLAQETWFTASFKKFFAGSWPWPHLLITECSIVGTLRPENAPPDWKLPNKSEMKSLQDERTTFYACLYKKAEERHPALTRPFL